MIWTITLWMAMQGQVDNSCAETPPSLCFYKGCGKMAVEIDGGCPLYTDAPTQFKPLKSAEHVFEIRTKRDESAPIKNEYLIGCREGFTLIQSEHVSGDVWTTEGCVRITRELWIDGKRLGTIKGLD